MKKTLAIVLVLAVPESAQLFFSYVNLSFPVRNILYD